MCASNKLVPKEDLESKLTQISAEYLDSTWIRAAFSAIPYIGGSLDHILGHKGRVVAQKRIEYLIRALAKELAVIQADKIDYSYLESEEWLDVFFRALERTMRIRDRNRIEAIARILRGAVTECYQVAHPEDLIDVVSELNDDEATVLGVIYRMIGKPSFHSERWVETSIEPYVPSHLKERLPFLLKRIESTGIIIVNSGYGMGSYGLTSTGRALLEYLAR